MAMHNTANSLILIEEARDFTPAPNGTWFFLQDRRHHVGNKAHIIKHGELYVHRFAVEQNMNRWNVEWSDGPQPSVRPRAQTRTDQSRLISLLSEALEIAHRLQS